MLSRLFYAYIFISFIFIVCGLCNNNNKVGSLMKFVYDNKIPQQLQQGSSFIQRSVQTTKQHGLDELTLECVICGIAINEIEGFLMENLTLQEMEKELKNHVCIYIPGFQAICDSLVDQIPYILKKIEQKWTVSGVCIDLHFCNQPFNYFPDPEPVPSYDINLDLPPEQRWKEICAVPKFQKVYQFMINAMNAILPDHGKTLEEIGDLLNQYYYPQEFAGEINGCAQVLGIPSGWLALINLGYEISDACTSIVAETNDGTILHARNLDFWEGIVLTDSMKNVTLIANWKKNGKTLFTSTSFAGYVGILSGMKPNKFSLTIDTRFYPQGLGQMFWEVIAAIEEKNASLVSFLSRQVLTNDENDYKAAVAQLSNSELIADVYYIVAGISSGQGAVISRNRINATDVWMLDNKAGRWFEVQTNYDHWQQPPWFDDRVVPANNGMKAMSQQHLTLQGMYNVLSIKPVFNMQTTYTMLAIPKNATYSTVTRWCPYPCVE